MAAILGLLAGLVALTCDQAKVRHLYQRMAKGVVAPPPLKITIGPADQVLPPLLSGGGPAADLMPAPGETTIAPNADRHCLDQAQGVFDQRYLACLKSRQH